MVTYLDLDNLREVNARLEHLGGDRLLRAVAHELARRAGPERTVVRVGGDEFVLLATVRAGSDPAHEARRCESIALLALESLAGDGYDSSGSVGTSWAPLPNDSDPVEVERLLDLLLRQLDLAQSEAKVKGGGRGVMFEPAMSTRAHTRTQLRRALPTAWGGGQITLAYQSVLDLRTGDVVGVESLLRWTHPDLGPISPPDAIDVAIDLGLITELGLQILQQASQDLIASGAPEGLRVGVNLASPQLRPSSIESLLEAVSSPGLAGRIWLEVTEQLLLQEQRHAAKALADLRAAGALIAIDDFGTGYCNLDYLCSLPFDLLKLDKLFAAHIGDQRHASVSRTVVETAEALEAEVIAEGLEDWATADTMLDLGCQFGQGYALRRPTTSIAEAIAPIPVPAGAKVGAARETASVPSQLRVAAGV